jgi:hypothetical protein
MPGVFFSYSHADEALRDQLEKQLAMLKRQGVIDTWHDRRIGAGQSIDQAIHAQMERDEIILLLVSPDFLASDYCYDIEMKRAMQRHEAGQAIVIPVILRACDWHNAPFGKLNATPRDGKPITQWPDIDEAFLQVAKAVREAAGRITASARPTPDPAFAPPPFSSAPATTSAATPTATTGGIIATAMETSARSSNLRLAKTFSQRDKDQFQLETFEFMARFFENSLTELQARNPGVEGAFRRVDANRFFATVYKNGKDVARGTVFMGGGAFSRGINYVQGETTSSSTLNEALSVEADDNMLYLTSMGMASFGRDRDPKLSQEGAAELFWRILIGPLQGSDW